MRERLDAIDAPKPCFDGSLVNIAGGLCITYDETSKASLWLVLQQLETLRQVE